MAQGLEQGRAKGLCLENVASLYDDLMNIHSRCNYLDTHICDCDESRAQVGWNGRGRILARRGYGACMLSRHMRKNGCLSCRASMPRVLAFRISIYLRAGHLGILS